MEWEIYILIQRFRLCSTLMSIKTQLLLSDENEKYLKKRNFKHCEYIFKKSNRSPTHYFNIRIRLNIDDVMKDQ